MMALSGHERRSAGRALCPITDRFCLSQLGMDGSARAQQSKGRSQAWAAEASAGRKVRESCMSVYSFSIFFHCLPYVARGSELLFVLVSGAQSGPWISDCPECAVAGSDQERRSPPLLRRGGQPANANEQRAREARGDQHTIQTTNPSTQGPIDTLSHRDTLAL